MKKIRKVRSGTRRPAHVVLLISETDPNITWLVTWACWWLIRIGVPPVSRSQFIRPSGRIPYVPLGAGCCRQRDGIWGQALRELVVLLSSLLQDAMAEAAGGYSVSILLLFLKNRTSGNCSVEKRHFPDSLAHGVAQGKLIPVPPPPPCPCGWSSSHPVGP